MGTVKGVGFNSWRRVGTTLPSVKVYNRREVDELIILDIAATPDKRPPDIDEVQQFARECFVPLTVGGGISNIDDIKQLLRAGADKVAINSSCYDNPDLITEAAQLYGSQCVVVSIDVRKHEDGRYECASHCGKTLRSIAPVTWAKTVENKGAGEILLASVERDGAMCGYDLDLIKLVSEAVSIPVIASGGASSYEDFRLAIQEAGAQAVSAASIFHFTEQTPLEAKTYLSKHGIPVRKI